MAHFDHPRILDELPQQPLQVLAIQARVLERNRKLDQQRAQLPFPGDRVQSLARFGFVLIGRPNGRGRRRLHHRQRGMRERAVQLGGENEIRIPRDLAHPQRASSGRMCP